MEMTKRRVFIAFLVAFSLVQVIFFVLRRSLHGTSKFFISRAHFLVSQQLAMTLGSYFIWSMLSPLIYSFGDDLNLRYTSKRCPMICLQDTCKALLCLFLALTHICFIFYFVWIGEEPNLFALFSFISVAVYLHMIVFLGAVAFLHAFSRALIKFGIFANFLRSAMAYQMTHRLIGMAVAILVVLWGLWVAHSPPNVRFVRVPVKDLPRPQIGVKLALLTDVHIGPSVGRTRVQQIVDLTNSLRPDVVAISGDLIDGFARDLAEAADPLRNLKSTYGAYFATGNHEYIHGDVVEWFEYLRHIGVLPLHNEHVNIEISNSSLCIAGVDDLYAERSRYPGHAMDYKKAISGCARNATVVVLAHQPNAAAIMLADRVAAAKMDLILSGHTHAGQMYIFVPLVYALNAFVRGLYYDSSSQTYIYVSAGVNYFGPPVKMFGTCEIILIELVILSEH
uniref:Metallophos domain-containing protein n=2 Tax=Ascaris TaxID=6251 RepID=A0A0M3HR38_ASCLU